MTRIALFHSVLGLRPGVEAAAEVFRAAGHQVRVVDQYDGRVFSDYSEADAFAGTSPRPVAGPPAASSGPCSSPARYR